MGVGSVVVVWWMLEWMKMGKVELEIAGRKREAWHLHQSAMKCRKVNLVVLRAY